MDNNIKKGRIIIEGNLSYFASAETCQNHLCSTASLINSVGIKPSHQDFHSKPGIHLRVWRDAEISKGGPQCRHNHHIRLKHNIYRGIATGSLHPGFSFHRVT